MIYPLKKKEKRWHTLVFWFTRFPRCLTRTCRTTVTGDNLFGWRTSGWWISDILADVTNDGKRWHVIVDKRSVFASSTDVGSVKSAPSLPFTSLFYLRSMFPGICFQAVCFYLVFTARRSVDVINTVGQKDVAFFSGISTRLFEAVVHRAEGYGQTVVTWQEVKATVTAATVTSVGRPCQRNGFR